jgi:hypothetical protein
VTAQVGGRASSPGRNATTGACASGSFSASAFNNTMRSGCCARRRERPRSRAVEQRYELAPSDVLAHSIMSSAWAETPGGTSRPSALAVLRLITSPNLVDCTVRSAGFSQPTETLREHRNSGLYLRVVRSERHEHADAPHPLALLRARRERPRGGLIDRLLA